MSQTHADLLALGPHAILLRGVNVGGHGKLPMKPFVVALAEAGLQAPASYIQSGNITCLSDLDPTGIAELVQGVMRDDFGLDRPVLVRTLPQIAALIRALPQAARDAPKSVMVYFHAGTEPHMPKVQPAPSETVIPLRGAVVLHAPDGIGRSRCAAQLDKVLPGSVTARNAATVAVLHSRLLALQAGLGEHGGI
ncbi:MAG: DUF1697 domain-containing protein [Pseudomonadota bacterium]